MNTSFQYNQHLSLNQQYLSAELENLYLHLLKFINNELKYDKEEEKIRIKEPKGQTFSPALEILCKKFNLSEFEKNILLLTAAVELDSRFFQLIGNINNSGQPSFSLAFSLFKNSHWNVLSNFSPLRYWKMIEIGNSAILTRAALKIDEHILHYITGIPYLHELLSIYIHPVSEKGILSELQLNKLEKFITASYQKEGNTLPVIIGTDKKERNLAAKKIAEKLGYGLFSIQLNNLPQTAIDLNNLSRIWNREAILNNYMLLADCSEMQYAEKQVQQAVSDFISKITIPVIICTNQWVPDTMLQVQEFEIPALTTDEQVHLWNKILSKYSINGNGIAGRLVSQFNLTGNAIQRATTTFYNQNTEGKPIQKNEAEKQLWKICSMQTTPQLNGLARKIESNASWQNLVLPDDQTAILKEIITHVKNRHIVYHQWGFAKTGGTRGLGISALFAGESGTGKTLASEVLANELNLSLYKIDLSQLVSKYIGETEKNLNKIFEAAGNSGAILLFDEADALFGKRSEVKDSHDRYSNIEVSYLLQKIEEYPGLVILTTNMKQAIDPAFIRRFRFIVQFPFPNTKQRIDIWKKIFPDPVPLKEVDIEKLSKLNISGGSIKNIAMNAAFIAANEDAPVQMNHIIKAAKKEYAKSGIPFTTEFRNYE